MTAPNATGAAREHGVTLWGAPGAGKSGLLGALYAASLHPESDAWTAHPKDCEDAFTQERLLEAYLGLRGRTNTKTGMPAAGSEYPALRLTLRRQRAGRSEGAVRVALVDPAGEFSTQLELASTPEGRALFARIANGAGVVWLVGAEQRAEDVAARLLLLQHLVALIEQSGGRQLAIPVALCLSKIDCLDEPARAAARTDPAAALRERMGETAFTWFEAACPAMRCFAVSSTGSVAGSVQPEGLDTLFDWLASVAQPRATIGDTVRDVMTSPRAAAMKTSLRERAVRVGRLFGTVPSALRSSFATLRMTVGPLLRGRAARLVIAAVVLGVSGTVAARRAPGMAGTVRAVSTFVSERWRTLRPRGGTSAGEVAPPVAPSRTITAAQAAERLARARFDATRGAWDDAVDVLGDALPPEPMRFAWDSLYVTAAVAAAAGAPNGRGAQQLREAAHARANGLVRRGPAGSRRLVGVRYARAVACLDGHLACPDVVDDLTWALMGPSSMSRDARSRLRALESRP